MIKNVIVSRRVSYCLATPQFLSRDASVLVSRRVSYVSRYLSLTTRQLLFRDALVCLPTRQLLSSDALAVSRHVTVIVSRRTQEGVQAHTSTMRKSCTRNDTYTVLYMPRYVHLVIYKPHVHREVCTRMYLHTGRWK